MTRFDRFMEAALYHPERGYYSSRIRSVGARGDFTTTPQLSNSLAKAIAQAFRKSDCQNIIEIGPGTGKLAKEVWLELPFLTKRKTRHHLVEVSGALREIQKKNAAHARNHKTIQAALAATRGKSFVYSNELVDAFPVRIFRKEREQWSELYLTGKQPEIQEHFSPVEEMPDSTLPGRNHPVHQRIEIHETYHHWLKSWLPRFTGQLLTIDYVASTPRPLDGTLRGYFQQDRLTGGNLHQNAGHIDLTTDVHFDDLEYWGNGLGLQTIKRQSQRDFLAPFTKKNPTDQFLTNPDGAGNAFEVLLQSR